MAVKGVGGRNATELDLLPVHERVVSELGLSARSYITLGKGGLLLVRSEVFRTAEGVRLGIAAYEESGRVFDRGIIGAVYRTLIRSYYDAADLAYKPIPGTTRKGR